MHHDELLFIIIHQTTELWFKLVVHELTAALDALDADDLDTASKILARVKHIQQQLFDQWGVLATLTPSEYTQFRSALGSSSGFQSVQYRTVEFLLGNKDAAMIAYHKHDPAAQAQLQTALERPSLYTTFLAHLSRRGFDVAPRGARARPHPAPRGARGRGRGLPAGLPVARQRLGCLRRPARSSSDLEENFSLWRFRHMKVVARIIGFKTGTGGSSGVPFLAKMVNHTFFPELWSVRTAL